MSSTNKSCDYLVVRKTDKDACEPTRATTDSAGWDIYTLDYVSIPRKGTAKIRTGLKIVGMPENSYCRLAERSSVSLQKLVLGGGVIDRDYQGEIYVVLHNIADTVASIPAKTAVAQLVFEKICTFEAVTCLDPEKEEPNTARGNKGFGEVSGVPPIDCGEQ